MRPLKLTMQAFGPYANKQEVDFTQLGEKTMFVVSGATGAGKTTIFDGISFAIYGRASGDDRVGSDLRSQFADNDTLTEVSLEFQLREKRYFIKRSPQQEKKKSRGEGTTTQGAKAELYELGDEETLLAANVRDVEEKINEIMKIDCHQFRQIMMIPQGEFRKLLVSDSKDKEKILQKLFHTEHYKRIEDALKEKAGQLRKEVEKSVHERSTYISRIQAEGNDHLQHLLKEDHINIEQLLEHLSILVKDDEATLKGFSNEITSKEEKRQFIEKEIHHGNHLIEQLEAKERILSQKEQLQSKEQEFEHVKERIQLANKALVIAQLEEQCLEIDRQVVTKDQELKNANNLLDKLKSELQHKEAKLKVEEDKVSEREACQKGINELQALEKDILSFSTVEKDVNLLGKQLSKMSSEKETLEEQLVTIEERAEALLQEKDSINEAKLEKSDLSMKLVKETTMLEKIRELLKNKAKLISFEKHFSACEDDREDLEDELEEENERLQQLFDAWNKGQASLLAQKLTDDDPCPVCGSKHHPDKANLHEGMPTEDEIKEVQKSVKQLEQEKQKLDASYYEAKSQFEVQMDLVIALADEVSEQLPYQLRSYALEELEEQYDHQCLEIKNKLNELEAKMKKAQQVESDIHTFNEKRHHLKAQLSEVVEQYEGQYTSYVEKRRDLERLSETIPENLRNEEEFNKKLSSEQDRMNALQSALQNAQKAVNESLQQIASAEGTISSLQKVVSELANRQKQLKKAFNDKLQEVGFNSLIEYSQAKLPEMEIRKLEASVQAYREEFRSVTDRYNELVTRLEGVEKPDLEKLYEQLNAINTEIEQLQENRNILYHKVKTNSSIIVAIEKINSEIASVEEQYKTVGELANIATGKNTYRVTFERYVLAAFLDEILVAANARLNKMTSGRYELQRKTERSKGTAQSGLELLVFDQYTGKTRHVKTLSGGESFKASLSLALGLADIVQSFSGGVSMETMFIDEGFGTLDAESLENAIETLVEIQSTGRLVGIISHVPELKERIDARFEVLSTQAGSIVKYYGDTISG